MSTPHDRAVRWAWRWTWLSLLGFGGFYFLGWYHTWRWDFSETCTYYHHETYDAAATQLSGTFPFKNTCNANYDLVPAYANPMIVVLGASFLLSVTFLIGAIVRRQQLRARI